MTEETKPKRVKSEETKRRISEGMKRMHANRTPEERARHAAINKGRKFSEESRRKMSESHKARYRRLKEEAAMYSRLEEDDATLPEGEASAVSSPQD